MSAETVRGKLDESMKLISQANAVLTCLGKLDSDDDVGVVWDVVETVKELLSRANDSIDNASSSVLHDIAPTESGGTP